MFWVGWSSIAGSLTLVTTEACFLAYFFSAAAVISSNGFFETQPEKTYLIFVAILTVGTHISLFGDRFLGWYNDRAFKYTSRHLFMYLMKWCCMI